jgi:hypothetical protein
LTAKLPTKDTATRERPQLAAAHAYLPKRKLLSFLSSSLRSTRGLNRPLVAQYSTVVQGLVTQSKRTRPGTTRTANGS